MQDYTESNLTLSDLQIDADHYRKLFNGSQEGLRSFFTVLIIQIKSLLHKFCEVWLYFGQVLQEINK